MIFKKIGKDKIAKNSESAEEKAAAENVAETESPEEDEQLQEEIDELIRKRATDPIQDELQIKELRQELRRVKYNNSFRAALFNTVGTLMVVAAAAILIAYLWLPILQVTGTSMAPTLSEGELLVASKLDTYETGDLIAFYYNNKILVKRVIATSGDWVDISEDGTVYVNNIALEEPYLTDKALGNCNIELPYQEMIDLHLTGNGWILDPDTATAERTVLYYSDILESGKTSPVFADTISINGDIATIVERTSEAADGTITTTYLYDGAQFVLEAEVDAVQTHNAKEAIASAWGVDVNIADDGSLSLQ